MSESDYIRTMIIRLLGDVYEKLIDLDMRLSALETGSTVMPLGYAKSKILELITQHFNREEIDALAFDVDGLEHDQIIGQTRGERARFLINYCERRGLVHVLLLTCQRERPSVTWPRPPLD